MTDSTRQPLLRDQPAINAFPDTPDLLPGGHDPRYLVASPVPPHQLVNPLITAGIKVATPGAVAIGRPSSTAMSSRVPPSVQKTPSLASSESFAHLHDDIDSSITPKRVSRLALLGIVVAFVVCGTASTVISKVLFQTESTGRHGQRGKFERPLAQNAAMFIGMSLCLPVYLARRWWRRRQRRPTQRRSVHSDESWRVYWLVGGPATADFAATWLMNVGLLWISGSVWQLLRGSVVVHSAILRYFLLKRRIHRFQWFAVALVLLALGIIGVAAVLGGSSDDLDSSSTEKVIGIALVLVSMFINAIQTVLEERLLQDVHADDLLIVGVEGIWGMALCFGFAMPLSANLPGGHEGDGIHEDTIDSLYMISNSNEVLLLVLTYTLVILGFNTFGMKLTLYTNSVTRNVLDSVRTVFIWVVLLTIHYTGSDSMGEAWTEWSYLQACGFFVLVSGVFLYNEVIRLPTCFNYPHLQQSDSDCYQTLPEQP